MIQRIQSLLLLIGAGLSILLLVMHFQQIVLDSNKEIVQMIDYNIFHYTVENSDTELIEEGLPLFPMLISLLIVLLSLFSIFLFKKRSLQSIISRFLILLSAALVVAFIFDLDKIGGIKLMTSAALINYLIIVLPVLMILVFFMANKAILKDEKLVKSADRIR